MRVMTDRQSEVLHRLCRLALGDALLVNRALREAANANGGTARIEDVIRIIQRETLPLVLQGA